MSVLVNLPAGFQTRYFTESEGDVMPQVERRENMLVIPVFIRTFEREGATFFKWFTAEIKFRGQAFTDYEKLLLQAAPDIRACFYGTPEQQGEMRDDATWEAHRQAVRSAFPKTPGELNPSAARWNALKEKIWQLVDDATAEVGKTRADLPDYFSDADMFAFAVENGMSEEDVAMYAQQFTAISLDLLHNSRNWKELFE